MDKEKVHVHEYNCKCDASAHSHCVCSAQENLSEMAKQPNTQTISLGSGHTEATVCIGKWVILDADDADSDMERAKWNSWMKTKEMELATMISDRFYTNPHYMQFLIFMLSRGIPASKADAITAASVKLIEK